MKTIQQLVDGGSTHAAFKYKANAEKFINAWKKKGYYVDYLRSSGPVVDDDKYCPTAYYVIAEKEAPKPLSKKDEKEIKEMERLVHLQKTDPRSYWRTHVKPSMIKHKSDFDPEIYNLVIELNDNDQFTSSSCAGHGKDRGHLFISSKKFNGTIIRTLMKKYGLTGITRGKTYVTPHEDRYEVYEFDPLGKPKKR
jgi:hypothetical protein